MTKKIVFLPGLFTGENEKFYKKIKEFFEKNNFEFIFFQYSNEKQSLDFSIEKTKKKIKDFFEKEKKDNIIFIGHSMAGPILSEFFIENNLKNKLILLDPSVIPIPKHLHKDVFLKKKNKNYLIWNNEDDLKEINEDYKKEYLEMEKDYSKLNKENVLVFFTNLKIIKEFLPKSFKKTYSNLNIIEIKDTDHYFENKEDELFYKILDFIE